MARPGPERRWCWGASRACVQKLLDARALEYRGRTMVHELYMVAQEFMTKFDTPVVSAYDAMLTRQVCCGRTGRRHFLLACATGRTAAASQRPCVALRRERMS